MFRGLQERPEALNTCLRVLRSVSESILQALIPYLLPTLTDALTEIEIPSIEGFSIGGVSSSTTDGYVRLSGQLQINP